MALFFFPYNNNNNLVSRDQCWFWLQYLKLPKCFISHSPFICNRVFMTENPGSFFYSTLVLNIYAGITNPLAVLSSDTLIFSARTALGYETSCNFELKNFIDQLIIIYWFYSNASRTECAVTLPNFSQFHRSFWRVKKLLQPTRIA